MTAKPRLPMAVLGCGMAVTVGLLAPASLRESSADPAKPGFTVKRVQKVYRVSTGEKVYTYESTYGRRSDGSSVEVRRIADPEGNTREQRVVIDLTGKRRLTLDGLTQSVTTYALSEAQVAEHRRRPACPVEPAERDQLLGFDVVRIEERTRTGKGTGFRVEKWVAPALDCLPLRERVFVSHAGDRFELAWEAEVTSVELVEPPAEWFEIPAGYVERSPSAVLDEFRRRFPSSCSRCGERTDDILDQVYYAHQPAIAGQPRSPGADQRPGADRRQAGDPAGKVGGRQR